MDYYASPPQKRRRPKGPLIAAFIVGGVLLVGGAFYGVMRVRAAAAQMTGTNNLRQIEIGAETYGDMYGYYPTPYHVDKSVASKWADPPADPSKRLSWRVTLIPYMEAGTLYNQFHRDEPWDSDANLPLSQTPLLSYIAAEDRPSVETRYRCFYDNGALFDSNPKARMRAKDIKDGAANTIMYVESADTVTWTQLNDFRFDPGDPLPALGHPKRSVFLTAMADGSVKAVRKTIDPAVLKQCIGRDDGGTAADLDR